MFALDWQPNRIGRVWIISYTSHTSTESQVAPCGQCTDIGTSVHSEFEVRDGIQIQITAEELLGNCINRTLRQTDAKSAGVCTSTACEVGDNYRIIYLIYA